MSHQEMFPVLLTAAGTMPGRVTDAGMLLLLAGVFLAGVGGGDSAVLDENIAGGAGDGDETAGYRGEL